MKMLISLLLIIAANIFVEAQLKETFVAKYALDEEYYADVRWQKGPSFQITDGHCSGYLNVTSEEIRELLCGSWLGIIAPPDALEMTTTDIHAYPSYSPLDNAMTGFAIWRAACDGSATVSTRVKCPYYRRALIEHLQQMYIPLPAVSDIVKENIQQYR